MPQRLRSTIKWKNFNFPVSYNTNAQDKMKDARNVYSNKDVLRTRNGVQRFNANVIDATSDVQSISFFKKNDNTRKYIGKAGTSLYDVSENSTHTAIKTGLTSANKHRSVTFLNRAIISSESDGLFAWSGSIFSQLGQDPPIAATLAKDEGGGTLSNTTWEVAITFFSSTLGFETNAGAASNQITTDGGNDALDVTGIPSTATNTFIDKVRVYLKDVSAGGNFLFVEELNLGTTSTNIDVVTLSTSSPPTKNAAPISGGGKFLAIFGKKLVYSGNSTNPDDIFFSEEYLPDAFDTTESRIVLKASGQGPVTGLGVGFYNNDNLNPFLCIFKKNSIEVYSELGGSPAVSLISSFVGCVSHDTVKEVNGDIYFMSENGFHIISSGKLVTKEDKAFKLGDGDIDSIFTEEGFVYEVNQSQSDNFFSIYYPTLNQYLTFVSEGSNVSINKAYNYEFDIKGFRPYDFPINFNDGAIAEDSGNQEVVLLAGNDGFIYKHSINITNHDVNKDNTSVIIDAFAQLYWIAHDDLDATLNFGTLVFKALSSADELTVKCFLNYEQDDPRDKPYDFSKSETGFILDISLLDEGILGDGRTIVRDWGSGVFRTAQSLLIGFYQSVLDSDMGIIQGQLDASKNGNIN